MRLLVLALIILPGFALAQPSPVAMCRAAITTAERENGIPPGLLHAIGRVESSRRDPQTGEVGPWPWTMNAEGTGRHFSTHPEAVAHVRQLQSQGIRSIDIGCMQINQIHHVRAFSSLEEGFEPLPNARYAAQFLKSLYQRHGDWLVAAGAYHSGTPGRAALYRAQVELRWPEEQRTAAAAQGWNPAWAQAARSAQAPVPTPVFAPNPTFAGTAFGLRGGHSAPTIIRMAGSTAAAPEGERGRGLDAYRSMAIPLATGSSPTLMRGLPGVRG
ncbi:transglycosylase SLT domain-containing protein [Muricoccus radiodurans]|uniref:transglycosylase SLT domain-containing protein n=1 Tax=Muricoccus radiodurans TaxID=2231721 RepID=UPI003CEAF532